MSNPAPYKRLKNQGRAFPLWIDTEDPDAKRGTIKLRTMDPNLTVGLNVRTHEYEVWGPSLEVGGWVPLCACLKDGGEPYRNPVPWDLIMVALRNAREGELSADWADRKNQEHLAAQEQQRTAFEEEALRFFLPAISGDLSGSGRHSGESAMDAWNRQTYGQKAAPKGRIISVGR
jgi:hypothetical protein